MRENLDIIILGLYTIAYIVVIVVQQSQIRSQNKTIENLKSFTDIFDLEKLKQYVAIKEESAKTMATEIIKNDKRFQHNMNLIKQKLIDEVPGKLATEYIDRQRELIIFAIKILKQQNKELRPKIIEANFKLNKDIFDDLIDEIDNIKDDQDNMS